MKQANLQPFPKREGRIFNRSRKTPSVCVADFEYDPLEDTLTIEFVNRGTYIYYDVPDWEATGLKYASSKGQYFNRSIRSRYDYERIA